MPRGQYDRAAAKAKRWTAEQVNSPELADALNARLDTSPLPRNDLVTHELQAKLDAANERIAKYQRLIKQHGLWLDE